MKARKTDRNQAPMVATMRLPPQPDEHADNASDWISIRQAASLLGVSERSVHHYVETGRLEGRRQATYWLVSQHAVATFVRRAAGRRRMRSPHWHQPPEQNAQVLTILTLRQHPGQEERLACVLEAMRTQNAHSLPGTAARYIVRSQDSPNEIMLVLVWRVSDMPSEEEQQAAFAALRGDLAEVLDWETAVVKEGQSLLHA